MGSLTSASLVKLVKGQPQLSQDGKSLMMASYSGIYVHDLSKAHRAYHSVINV